MPVNSNPLAAHLSEWLPAVDVAVLGHGFAPHGRDYIVVIQDSIGPKPGTYELTFTHIVHLTYETRVHDDVLIDYSRWQAAGEPSGYFWGNNWSLAYPGIEAPNDAPERSIGLGDWGSRCILCRWRPSAFASQWYFTTFAFAASLMTQAL